MAERGSIERAELHLRLEGGLGQFDHTLLADVRPATAESPPSSQLASERTAGLPEGPALSAPLEAQLQALLGQRLGRYERPRQLRYLPAGPPRDPFIEDMSGYPAPAGFVFALTPNPSFARAVCTNTKPPLSRGFCCLGSCVKSTKR